MDERREIITHDVVVDELAQGGKPRSHSSLGRGKDGEAGGWGWGL